jgi:hypothetical protein
MSELHSLAKLLVCSWTLGETERQDLPTSHGILDRALQLVRDEGSFPEWVWRELHFADSRVGLQCVELPDILDWAQTAELTEVRNPSYRGTRIKIDQRTARRLLASLRVSEDEASRWGRTLREKARQAAREFEVLEARNGADSVPVTGFP